MADPDGPPGPPDAPPPAPGAPEPAAEGPRVYALPTARRVVASGLALALASTGDLRRASIYIGLLVLGAFGPAIVALLLVVGRLGDGALEAFASLLTDSAIGGDPIRPALEAAMLVVAFDALLGLLLFVAISIDAQVIAIAILGGRAADRPLRLWEAITRARQTFWRMAGAGTLVGFVSLIVQGLIVSAIDGFSRSPEASSIFGALLATIVIAPLAYVSSGIVLGDVGAMEALSRSVRLFRARRSLAVVVVLFTLVTSAIHLFAFGAGADLVVRAAEILHVSLTEGALAFLAAVVLILAAVVAYGSLSFTVGAVVAAPQVTGFLGLTFYSAGLDKARGEGSRPPKGFRYVSRPMTAAIVVLAGIVALEIPAINSIEPPPPSAGLAFVRAAAERQADADRIDVQGRPEVVTDPPGDGATGGDAPGGGTSGDLLQAEGAYVAPVPDWLLAEFDCSVPAVACGEGSSAEAFEDGAYLFVHRLAAPPAADRPVDVAVLLALDNEITASGEGGFGAFRGASRVIVVTLGPEPRVAALRSSGFELRSLPTASRAAWDGADVYSLVPVRELPFSPIAWDALAFAGRAADGTSRDGLRSEPADALPAWDGYAAIFVTDYRDLEP